MLKQKLQEDLRQAMLTKDQVKISTLRLLLSAISYHEIQKGKAGYIATDEDVLSVLQKEAKQRRDSISQFQSANRQELVEKETRELEIIESYLPKQMDEEAIRKLIQEALRQTNAASLKDIGKVMGWLMPKIKGKADGGFVNQLVREALAHS